MNRFNYIIPGIMNAVNDARDWDYQAQAWLYNHGCGLSAGFNYFAGVAEGLLSRSRFGAMVASDLRPARAAGMSIRGVGHSNAAGIWVEALKESPSLFVDELHLIAAAIDADCKLNWLNMLAARGQIGKLVLYVSADDEILSLPVISYGRLGRDGPKNVGPELAKILSIVRPDADQVPMRHCDWVGKWFERTMNTVVSGQYAASDQTDHSALTTDNSDENPDGVMAAGYGGGMDAAPALGAGTETQNAKLETQNTTTAGAPPTSTGTTGGSA